MMENNFDFSNILNSSITASWLIMVVVLLRFLLKKAPKWTHVALWGLVAARLLLPFSIESAFSLIPSAQTVPREILRFEGTKLQEPAYLDVISNPVFLSDISVELEQTVDRVQVHILNMTFIWLAGIAILILYTVISYLRLHCKVDTAVRYKDNIFQSENVSSPFVLGIIKPKIYLPFKLGGQNLEHVVAHEQAHIRRKDHWWKPLGFLLLTLHWFNPLMWLAYVLLCRDIELACDEKVIKKLDNEQRADYTQALVACSVNRRTLAACPLAFGEVGVKERVKSIMNYKRPAFWIVILAVIACVVVAVCFLTNPVDEEPDLSFLNYQNAILLVADVDEVMAMYCPSSDGGSGASIQIGVATGADLAKQLDKWEWKECTAPRQSLPSPGSVEFVISEDYRIVVHQRKSGSLFQYAVVKYQDEVRYYRIDKNDYPTAVALVHAPKENTQASPVGKSYVYENAGFVGNFAITLYADGTFSYYEGMASSYFGSGTWKQEENIVILTDDAEMGYAFTNYFILDGDDLVFMEEDSSNFLYVKVKDGERFNYEPNDRTHSLD